MHALHFFILFLLLFFIEMGVEAGGCICVLSICIEELGVPGGSACSTYMYDLFVFHFSWHIRQHG